jgi:hypothetical protein
VMDLDTQTPPSDDSTLACLPTYATVPSETANSSIATNSTPTRPSPQTQPCHVPTAQAVAIEHDAMLHQLSDHGAGSAPNHNASTRRDQVGQISLFQVGDLLFTTILMLPMLYSFTLPLADQSAEAISAALDNTQRGAAMNGFHLRWSHANSAPAWSSSEVGRLLSSCAIPIAAGSQHSKRHATRVERRIDLIKDQHLLQRSSTSMLTTTELIIAANIQVNLRTDHITQPGSSPTDRFVGGPSTYSHTTKLAPPLYETQVRLGTSDEVDPMHDDDYPYWDRAADSDQHTSLHAPPPFETQASSLDVPHVAAHQPGSPSNINITAIQFVDDLLVNDAQHQYVRHLAAILTTAMTLRRRGTTYE